MTETSARFVGVPRVFEKIEEGMKAAGAKSGLKKKVKTVNVQKDFMTEYYTKSRESFHAKVVLD